MTPQNRASAVGENRQRIDLTELSSEPPTPTRNEHDNLAQRISARHNNIKDQIANYFKRGDSVTAKSPKAITKFSSSKQDKYSENIPFDGADVENYNFVKEPEKTEFLGIKKEQSQPIKKFKQSPNRQQFGNYLLKTKTGFKTDRSQKTNDEKEGINGTQ